MTNTLSFEEFQGRTHRNFFYYLWNVFCKSEIIFKNFRKRYHSSTIHEENFLRWPLSTAGRHGWKLGLWNLVGGRQTNTIQSSNLETQHSFWPSHSFYKTLLEWVAIPFSMGPSRPKDQTWVSCIAGRFLTVWATKEGHKRMYPWKIRPDSLEGAKLRLASLFSSIILIK